MVGLDPRDKSVKIRVMVSAGRADELWFGADAVWDIRVLEVHTEVKIHPDLVVVHRASRECAIDTENDSRRARCAGKVGTVVEVDKRDQSVLVRVIISPGRADELWFGVAAVEPLLK